MHWKRDFSSHQNYQRSVEENKVRFKKYLGVLDRESSSAPKYNPALPAWSKPVYMEKYVVAGDSVLIAETPAYRVFQVRWPVLERLYGEGLLVQPKSGRSAASIVTLPDADQTPEQLLGLAPGIAPASQLARTLAENGFEVLIPVLIDRKTLFADQDYRQSRRE